VILTVTDFNIEAVPNELFRLSSLVYIININVHQRRMLRREQLIIMAGMERMECYQTHGNQVFGVFDTIPLIPPQPLL
jgi:hypothetical protein